LLLAPTLIHYCHTTITLQGGSENTNSFSVFSSFFLFSRIRNSCQIANTLASRMAMADIKMPNSEHFYALSYVSLVVAYQTKIIFMWISYFQAWFEKASRMPTQRLSVLLSPSLFSRSHFKWFLYLWESKIVIRMWCFVWTSKSKVDYLVFIFSELFYPDSNFNLNTYLYENFLNILR
jgi:hypothetical protein